jgi:glycosyltransferase involved in cell wall biosynthesis
MSFVVPAGVRHGETPKLRADAVFVPAASGLGADARELSVQIRQVIVDAHVLLDFGRTTGAFQPPTETPTPPALTIVGYLSDGTGVSAGAHASIGACKAAGIACELIDARPLAPCRGAYPISLMHVNADETPRIAGLLGEQFFRDRHTIGYWAWELEDLPGMFLNAFEWVDEVWAPSSFVQRAISDTSPVPVILMPHAVTVEEATAVARARFDLPDSPFLFLTMYDVLSIQERKNPLGAIEAFRQAFPDAKGVGLVVRVNHASSRPEDVAVVRQAVERTAGAILIDRRMSREDALALQASCDAFVSLHRSEGFGLNIAEAMLMGKPVVVTGWSGNLDFTTHRNSCLVDYELITLNEDHGPYRKGSRWAEPDLDQASEFLDRLVRDSVYREQIAARGRATIADGFSPAEIGRRYQRRLALIDGRPRRHPDLSRG